MDRRIAVSEFFMTTCAPAIARPELSMTRPEIVPPATCAREALLVTSAIAVTQGTVKQLEFNAATITKTTSQHCCQALTRIGRAELSQSPTGTKDRARGCVFDTVPYILLVIPLQ